MNNKEKYIITVRFPEWEQTFGGETHKYQAFGVKYLLTTFIHADPEWPEDDERWFSYDPLVAAKDDFISWYKSNIKPEFEGEILFIEPTDLVNADMTAKYLNKK